MQAGFADPKHEEDFLRDGFIRIPFLNPAQCDEILAGYQELQANLAVDFTINSSDTAYRRKMIDLVKGVQGERIAELLPNSRFFGNNFVVKTPGQSHLALHQDNAISDESRYCAVLCWCAMIDIDEPLGCLTVVPGSHRWTYQTRAFGDQLERGPFRNVIELLHERCQIAAPTPKGTAIFYDPRTLHGSLPNKTDKPRIATLSATLLCDAELLFHHRLSDTQVEAFSTEESFYWLDDFVFKRPKLARSLGIVDIHEQPPIEAEVLTVLAEDAASRCALATKFASS